jgi:transposase
MLSLPLPVRVFLSTQPADMRRSFDGLALLVQEHLGQDPLSGDLFVFRSKRGDRVKMLYWQEDGYCLWYKRLELGTFRFPALPAAGQSGPYARAGDHGLVIRAAELAMLLDGVELSSVKRRPRYRRPARTQRVVGAASA